MVDGVSEDDGSDGHGAERNEEERTASEGLRRKERVRGRLDERAGDGRTSTR